MACLSLACALTEASEPSSDVVKYLYAKPVRPIRPKLTKDIGESMLLNAPTRTDPMLPPAALTCVIT